MYIRKTVDEFEVQGNYGFGFELVTTETTFKLAKESKKDYIKNEPGVAFRIVKKRVKKESV